MRQKGVPFTAGRLLVLRRMNFVTVSVIVLLASVIGLTMLLRCFRSTCGYRPLWSVMLVLSTAWAIVAVSAGRDFYRVANQDFSGSAGNVGMYLFFIFVAITAFAIPNAALLPSLLIAFPAKRAETAGRRQAAMYFALIPIILFQFSFVSVGIWALATGNFQALLST